MLSMDPIARVILNLPGSSSASSSVFDTGISPPNSPVTGSHGWVNNRVAKTGVPVSGKGFNNLLYEAKEL